MFSAYNPPAQKVIEENVKTNRSIAQLETIITKCYHSPCASERPHITVIE